MTKLLNLIFKKTDWRECIMTIVGVFLGIGGISLLTYLTEQPFLIAPFGASAVLLYCASSSPLAQPRNFIGSHFIAATIGITCVNLIGDGWYTAAIAVALAILAMMVTNTVHPPGGATALLTVLTGTTSYLFLLKPIAIGVAIMFAAAILSARIFPGVRPYPYKKAN